MLNTYKKPWNITKKENRQNNNSDVKWIWCFIHLSLFTLLSIDMCTYYDSFSFWIYILYTCVCIYIYISCQSIEWTVKWTKERKKHVQQQNTKLLWKLMTNRCMNVFSCIQLVKDRMIERKKNIFFWRNFYSSQKL